MSNNRQKLDAIADAARREKLSSPAIIQTGHPMRLPGARLAKTQEAAQADEFISVKLLDTDNATEIGNAFDAKCLFVDSATAADTCLPRIQSGKTVKVEQINGTWFLTYPTLTDSEDCS